MSYTVCSTVSRNTSYDHSHISSPTYFNKLSVIPTILSYISFNEEKIQQYLHCASATSTASAPPDTKTPANRSSNMKVEASGEKRSAHDDLDKAEDKEDRLGLLQQKELGKTEDIGACGPGAVDDEEDRLCLLQKKELGKTAERRAEPTTPAESSNVHPTDTDATVARSLQQQQTQPLPASNNSVGGTGGRPGAYSNHPGGESFRLQPTSASALMTPDTSVASRTVSAESNTVQSANNGSAISSNNNSDNRGLVEARPVSDEEDPPRAVAQEERISSKSEASEQPCWKRYRCALLGSAAFVAFMVLVLFLSGVFNSTNNSGTEDMALQPSTHSNTMSPESLYVQSFLPQSTLDALQKSVSPQSKAFKWLQDDPQVLLYPEERIKQRFALATFYFATDGRQWMNNKDWLSYELHECQWAAMPGYSGLLSLPMFTLELPPCDEAFYEELAEVEDLAEANSDEEPGLYRHINGTTGAYKRLWLKENNLAGTLPEELFWLSSLKSINVMGNFNLTGTVPTSFGALSNLEDLTLTDIQFTGKLDRRGTVCLYYLWS